jgi:hypothetical protein
MIVNGGPLGRGLPYAPLISEDCSPGLNAVSYAAICGGGEMGCW